MKWPNKNFEVHIDIYLRMQLKSDDKTWNYYAQSAYDKLVNY